MHLINYKYSLPGLQFWLIIYFINPWFWLRYFWHLCVPTVVPCLPIVVWLHQCYRAVICYLEWTYECLYLILALIAHWMTRNYISAYFWPLWLVYLYTGFAKWWARWTSSVSLYSGILFPVLDTQSKVNPGSSRRLFTCEFDLL